MLLQSFTRTTQLHSSRPSVFTQLQSSRQSTQLNTSWSTKLTHELLTQANVKQKVQINLNPSKNCVSKFIHEKCLNKKNTLDFL